MKPLPNLRPNLAKHLAFPAAAAIAIGSVTAVPAAAVTSSGNVGTTPSGVINHSCGLNVSAHEGYLSPPRNRRTVKIGSAVVELRAGATASMVLEWGRIRHAKKGESVWLDWADGSHKNWHLCGPAKVKSGSDALTRANNPMPGRYMRACGHHAGVTKCTTWD